MRSTLDRSAPRAPTAPVAGFDPDTPVQGWYRMRLVGGGVPVGIRIWFGPPKDPVTGEELDRSPRWQAEANGTYIDLERVWPKCADDAVAEAEYRHLCSVQEWGRQHAPNSPQANPNRRVDPLTAPLPF